MYKKIYELRCIFLTAIIVSTLIMTFGVFASAGETTTVSIEPPVIIATALVPGKNFTINMTVTNVVDLYTWQIKLYFDNTILNCTKDMMWLPADHVFAGKSYMPVTPVIDEDVGGWYIWYGCSLVGDEPTFDGTGTMCQINFTVIAMGSSTLTFSTPLGVDTFLWDSYLDDIEFTVTDGYFSNRLLPPTATVYVDPSKIVNPSLVPCENFTVNINIINATDLYSFEFKLSFNQTVLNVVEATLGDFFPPSVVPTVVIDNMAGHMSFSASLSPPQSPISGDGTLAIIKFHVEDLGVSDLHLYDVLLKDQAELELPVETFDGYFNNMLIAKLYVDPPEIINPTLMPPATVQVNITIDDVEDMYGYEFKLGYDTDILVCVDVTIHPVLGETNYIPNLNIDNIAGIVWINVTYYSPAVPITTYSPKALATITFRIKAMGSSALDLYDTRLVDPTGQPIPHEVGDGLIMTLTRDVAVTDVTTSQNVTYQGWIINITVVARNEGDINETFDIEIYYGTTIIGILTVTDLVPSAETTLILSWDTTNTSVCSNLTISAEAVPVPDEIDLTNNVFVDGYVKIKLMGDINNDNKVDMQDLATAAKYFGIDSEDPRWNPDIDLNEDGKIDMRDIVLIAKNFGKKCPI